MNPTAHGGWTVRARRTAMTRRTFNFMVEMFGIEFLWWSQICGPVVSLCCLPQNKDEVMQSTWPSTLSGTLAIAWLLFLCAQRDKDTGQRIVDTPECIRFAAPAEESCAHHLCKDRCEDCCSGSSVFPGKVIRWHGVFTMLPLSPRSAPDLREFCFKRQLQSCMARYVALVVVSDHR